MARYYCANQGAKPQAYFVYGKVEQRRVAQKYPSVGRFVIFKTGPNKSQRHYCDYERMKSLLLDGAIGFHAHVNPRGLAFMRRCATLAAWGFTQRLD